MQTLVRRVASLGSLHVGSARAVTLACGLAVALLACGAWFGYSDRWLAILSATLSLVTFLLVFLLQYRENRDTAAIQLKLNELLRAVEGAREREFLDLEHLAEEEQERILDQQRRRHRASVG